MNILRLSTHSLAIVFLAMGTLILSINSALAHHCNGKHRNDPECGDPGTPPDDPSAVEYTAELRGAITFGPLSVNADGGVGLRNFNDLPVTAPTDEFFTTWTQVFEFCDLLNQPVLDFTASANRKGWTIEKPGGVVVIFRDMGRFDSYAGELDVWMWLIGDCTYSGGDTLCEPFFPDPDTEYEEGRGKGISEIPLIRYVINASGKKGVNRLIEGCHGGDGTLEQESTLVITATKP